MTKKQQKYDAEHMIQAIKLNSGNRICQGGC